MILPTKHLSIERSIINLGAELLKKLDSGDTVSALWEKSRNIESVRTFEDFTLALNFLFMLGLVDFTSGKLRRIKC